MIRQDARHRNWRPLVALETAALVSATGNGVALIALPCHASFQRALDGLDTRPAPHA